MAPVWDSLNDQMGAAGEAQRSQYAAITATGAGFVEGVGGLYEAGAKAEARDNALRDSAAAAAKGLTALETSTMSLSRLIDEMVARDRGVTDDDKLDPPGTEATGAITRMDTQIRDVTLQVASFLASNNVLGSQTAMGGMNFVQGGIQDVMSMFMPAGYVGAGAQRSTEYGPATGKFKAGPGAVDVMFDGVGRTVNDVWQELKTRDSEEKQLAYLKQAQEVTGTDFLKRDAANQYNTYGERGRTRLVGGTGLAATETERRNQLEAAQKAMQEVDESKKWKGLGKFFTGDEGQGLSMAERIEKAIEKQTTELKPPAKEITANDPSGNAALDASGHYLSGTGVQ